MLKKLFKYEWKSVSWMNVLLAGIAVCVTLLGVVYFEASLWKGMDSNEATGLVSTVIGQMIGIAGVFIYVIMLVGVRFGQSIYLGMKYYRSMFSDEGYLTHTLPVKSWELLFTKVFTAGIWTLVINLLLTALTVILVSTAICNVGDISFSELWNGLRDGYSDLYLIVGEELGGNLRSIFFSWLFLMILNPFLSTIILFGGLTIGQYSQRNKGFMGVLAFFGVRFVIMMWTVWCRWRW